MQLDVVAHAFNTSILGAELGLHRPCLKKQNNSKDEKYSMQENNFFVVRS